MSRRQAVHDRWWNHRLRPNQKALIDAVLSYRFVAVLGARQRGKTTAVGYAAGMLAQGSEWTRQDGVTSFIPADDVQIGSHTLKHAKDFVKRSGRILDTFNVGLSVHDAGLNVFDSRLGSTERIMLANGRQVMAHAGNPETIQGMSGHVFADEIAASKHDPEDIFQQGIAVASGAPHRRFVMVGNSSFKGDWWWNFWHGTGPIPDDPGMTWEKRREGFACFKLDVWSEFPDRILPPDLREIREILGPKAWARWYECAFADSHGRAIPDELIIRTGIVGQVTPSHAQVVVSVDPGLNRNPTGVVVARVGSMGTDVLFAEYWYGPRENDPAIAESWIRAQLDQIDTLVERFGADRVIVDYSNLAAGLGDALEEVYGDIMVAKTRTTSDRTQRRWGLLLDQLLAGRVSIPSECQDLRDDLARFELDESSSASRKITESGKLILPESPAPSGHVLHCDIGAALLQCSDVVWEDAG